FGSGLSSERGAFSPDGKILAVGGAPGQPCRLWDVATGKELRTIGKARGREPFTEDILAFSPDGKTIVQAPASRTSFKPSAPAPSKILKVWDTATGEELREIKGEQDGVSILAFSADGKLLATGTSSYDGSVFVWNLETGKVQGSFGTREKIEQIRALAF